jgi:hypothetical protein
MTANTSAKSIASLTIEMAKPRFAMSALVEADVVSSFRGLYARIARKMNVSPSMVSRVADGHRVSPKIQTALREELKMLKQKLDRLS